MGALEPMPETMKGAKKLIKVFAVVLLLIGILELVGAFSGATNPLDPLEKLKPVQSGGQVTAQNTIRFQPVHNIEEFERAVAASKKPVMLDFSADWCTSCKEFEHITFKDPKVVALLQNFTLLRADVTQNSPEEKALLKRFNLFGPPALIFYKNGKMLPNFKTIGYKKPQELIPVLTKILKQDS